jgi:aspartyl-tRNA(Asn)/glutamyl-tRNA(Gln) amidotransferase subunit A
VDSTTSAAACPQTLIEAIDDPTKRDAFGSQAMTEAFLDRIKSWQETINAFITVTGASARETAADADRARLEGRSLGVLHGVIVGVKDDIDVAGVRCTVGSAVYRDRIAGRDAAVVTRLREAGAVIIGKLGLSEFALGSTSDNVHFGAVRNPWDAMRYPGGSSGGPAAAVAADLCVAALGSDAGGSVRVPAALCGVTGLRPSMGTIPDGGTHQVAPSIETVGPLARSARDVARIMQVIRRAPERHRSDGLDELLRDTPIDLKSLRVGLPRTFFFDDVDEDIVAAVRRVADELERLGADVRDVDVPGAEDTVEAARIMIVVDAFAIHEHRLAADPDAYGDEVRERMLTGALPAAAELARAHQKALVWSHTLDRAFEHVDLLLTPTTLTTARPFVGTRMLSETAMISRLAVPFSIAGVPALSIPCGLSHEGLPIGAQLVARRFDDDVVLRAAVALQQATDWHRARPIQPLRT